jgi:NADH:ubiquinone oxidoreductase subunit 4 (subunit M)
MLSNSLFIILIIIPILIKMPSFPFFYWLPEVHSESNSSISLLLAGLILKLSIYGLIRFILSTFYLSLQFLTTFLLIFTLLGVLIITCSCFRYFDLKKIIAFSSILHLNLVLVLHLNLVLVSCLSFNSCGLLSGIFISLSHSFSSIALFLLAGLLINKTYSRYIDSIFMLDLILRAILVLFILANLNVPGSINFIGEILSLISILSIDTFYIIFFLFTSFLSSLFWFIILNRKLTYNYSYSLWLNHLLILIWLFIIIFYLGYYFLFHYYS